MDLPAKSSVGQKRIIAERTQFPLGSEHDYSDDCPTENRPRPPGSVGQSPLAILFRTA
jgi:hypothetical protein